MRQTTLSWNNPISALWDQNRYNGSRPADTWLSDMGLAEFTNANFVSQDTAYGPYPYPFLAEIAVDWSNPETRVEDGKTYKVYYIFHPQEGYHLATVSFLEKYNPSEDVFVEDDVVWEDYAAKLVPRAVGYSAALLKYFFRGDFDVSKAVFELNSAKDEIEGISMMVKNVSKLSEGGADEALGEGAISLVCKYIPPGETEPEYQIIENAYTVNAANDAINSDYQPINKTFAEPIPLGATDISLALVFKGKMGNETDAVASRVLNFTTRIAFSNKSIEDSSVNIYTILPNGTGQMKITNAVGTGVCYFSPAWSPDGTLLAFLMDSCGGNRNEGGVCDSAANYNREIWTVDLFSKACFPGSITKTLHFQDLDTFPNSDRFPAHFSFSPDSTRVVSVLALKSYYSNALVIQDLFDNNWEYILDDDGNWLRTDLIGSPAWSPQGNTIAFGLGYRAFYAEGNLIYEDKADIHTVSSEGGTGTCITDSNSCMGPAWSINGNRIFFVSDRDGEGGYDIWSMDNYGNNLVKIYDCDGDCSSPSPSPDGQKICFAANGDIYTINVDGTDLVLVTNSGFASSPAWSPLILEMPAH
jgi:hypothetical protein